MLLPGRGLHAIQPLVEKRSAATDANDADGATVLVSAAEDVHLDVVKYLAGERVLSCIFALAFPNCSSFWIHVRIANGPHLQVSWSEKNYTYVHYNLLRKHWRMNCVQGRIRLIPRMETILAWSHCFH